MKVDKNITVEDAREMVSNRLLWPRVRDFLWDFAPQVHESWLEGMEWRKTPGVDMSSSRAKRLVLDSLGVEPCFHSFPKDDGSRIVLLDGATIESVVKWLGALASADSLRRVTSGPVVRELKASLSGIYPEVFGYTMYFRDFAAKNAEDAKTPEGIAAIGLKMLFSQLADLPEPLVARLKFKLPKSLCELCVLCGKEECAVSGSVVLKLLKLKFPEAYKLCCS